MSMPASIASLNLRTARPTSTQPRKKGLRLGSVSRPVALNSIAISSTGAFSGALAVRRTHSSLLLGIAFIALASHLGLGIYAAYFAQSPTKPLKQELALEIVAPKPPEPKIEPPKPEPPKPQLIQKQAQVLPPIQTPTPAPSQNAVESSEPPTPVAPIVSTPAPEPPVPVTAPLGKAGYLNNPAPNYPPAASRAGWQGTVKLRVHVLGNGRPDVVEVQTSSGRKILDEEAARTVKTWTLAPAMRGDTPVDGWANVPIEFSLE